MSNLQLFIGLVVGVLVFLIALAAILPCEGCRLRRERIARGIAKLRTRNLSED